MTKFSILFLLIFISSAIAQKSQNESTITISGKVLEDESRLPLEYATVTFINQEGTIVNGGITDQDGVYSIDVSPGTYSIRYEFISYKTRQLNNQKLFSNTTLPDIRLELDAASLDEVVIRAETTEVQVRLDKKIYNIGKDLTTSGSTVSDALNNVPSVSVDVEGAISLRGNENVRILINGKPSAIAGFGSTDALGQLPAEAIDRVEVITSPSARYDAEGTAGIINIILRKEKTLGLNGSLQTNIGWPTSGSANLNINLRTDKFNIFNTTGFSYNDSPGNAFYDNYYFSDSVENPHVTEDREYDRFRQGFNTNLGMEYFLTDTSSITGTAFLRSGDNDTETTNNTNEYNSLDELAINSIRTEYETEENSNYQFSLYYENNFSKDGHKLTADLQYEREKETQISNIEEYDTFPEYDRQPSENINSVETQNEYLAQADYVRPIGESAQFEAGYRGDFEESVTDYQLFSEIGTTGEFVKNDSLSNLFTYEQLVNAFYSQYGSKLGKLSFLLGLRLENTRLLGNVSAEDVTDTASDLVINFDKNYLGLFPTVNLTFEIGDRENLTLGYNRRINRPRSWYINPFPSRSSEANVFQGNPDLDPAYANAFDLGYLKRWNKLTLTSSIYYQLETDAFERIQEDTGFTTSNGIPIIRTTPINLSTNERIGFEAGVLYNPLKWMQLNGSFNFYRFTTVGSYNDVDYGAEDNSWFARASMKITLPISIEWQTNGYFQGPSSNSQTETESNVSLNTAFSKDIMEGNATLGFNVSDLLNSRKRISITTTDTFSSYSEFQWRQRQFNLSFTYRFNEEKKRQRGRGDGNGGGDFEFEGGAGM